MFKKFRVMTVVALAAFAVTVTVGALTAADDKVPTTSEIMKSSFGGKTSLKNKISASVKGENWDDVKKLAAEFKAHGEALGKNKPKVGDADSWKKLSDAFKTNTDAVADAADNKDAKAVVAALGKINCMECHDAHRPKKK